MACDPSPRTSRSALHRLARLFKQKVFTDGLQRRNGVCPSCGQSGARIHSHYQLSPTGFHGTSCIGCGAVRSPDQSPEQDCGAFRDRIGWRGRRAACGATRHLGECRHVPPISSPNGIRPCRIATRDRSGGLGDAAGTPLRGDHRRFGISSPNRVTPRQSERLSDWITRASGASVPRLGRIGPRAGHRIMQLRNRFPASHQTPRYAANHPAKLA